jgi:hypothetical protein
MKLLVLTAAPITAEDVRRALPEEVDPSAGEVLVVAPAIQSGPLRFWVSDADEAIDRAEHAQAETVEALQADGASAHGDTGESDPETALQDALQTFPADRIVVFARAGDSGGYREDVDPVALQERFGVPVERVELG